MSNEKLLINDRKSNNSEVMRNKQIKLKPCPFCGGKAMLLSTDTPLFGETPRFFVTCAVCGVETPRIARKRTEAANAWNRRVDNEQSENM